jgi:biopolymer transport protein ExbB/TolQ
MAATFSLNCPHCNYRIRASTDHIGRTGRCPNCQGLVEIKASGEAKSMAVQAASRSAPPKAASTDSPSWLTGVIAVVVTVLLYLLVFMPLARTDFGQKFVNRGSVMYFETLFFCWGTTILALKYFAVKRQLSYAELELQLIPLEIGMQIDQSNVDQFLNNLMGQNQAVRSSILGRRITGALEHFRSRNNVSEVQSYLSTQGEIDASAVDSGYTLLKAFIWAIPILGFIGTVIGLSDAVGGLQSAGVSDDVTGALQAAMTQVTRGLATAFDTTLVALVMAILLLFPMESLRRIEYAMLDRIEQFANESLLRRLSDRQATPDADHLPEVVRQALDSAFQQHQKWLAQWQLQVSQLGQVVGAEFESAVVRVKEQLENTEAQRMAKLHELSRAIHDLLQTSSESTLTWHKSEQPLADRAQSLSSAVSRLDDSVAKVLDRVASVTSAQAPGGSADPELREQLARLEQQIAYLAQAIDRASSGGDGVPSSSAPLLSPDPLPAKKAGRGLFGMWRN